MKYVNNILILSILILITSCEQHNIDEEIIADWQFISITDTGGADVKQIGPEDLMRIRKDHTFTYQLALEDIQARGDWEIDGDVLFYSYDENQDGQPEYTRRYNIKDISDTTLILQEEGVNYHFTRERE